MNVKLMGRILLVSFVLLLATDRVLSCPVCFGQTESNSNEAVNAAVWMLLGVTGSVLGLLSALFLRIRRRIRMTLHGSVDYPSSN